MWRLLHATIWGGGGVDGTPWKGRGFPNLCFAGSSENVCEFFLRIFGAAPLQKCVGDFCGINLENFAGDFPGGFIWALFPQKMRGKNPAKKSAKKKIRQLKNKNLQKNPFCQKPPLNFAGSSETFVDFFFEFA